MPLVVSTVTTATMFLAIVQMTTSSSNQPLQCYTTLAPQGKIICPEDRMNFCIKETINSTRRECGTTALHPFDEWDVKGGLCVYRKCGASCPNETEHFEGRDGLNHSRSTSCCTKTLCNSGYFLRGSFIGFVGLSQISITILLLMM